MFRSPLFNDFVSLRDTVDRLFNESFNDDQYRTTWSRSGNGRTQAMPMALDVYATDDQVVILAAVPGMRPEDLDLTIHENTITISGKIANVAESNETKGATWYVHELWSGDVRRSLTLPFPVDSDRADARFEQGILRVALPKAASAKPRKIKIGSGTEQSALAAGETQSEGSDE
jgi:HSP20 family protein